MRKTTEKILGRSSFSNDALLTTNYLDDYIVRGNVFTAGLSLDFTADVPQYFTSEYEDTSLLNSVFLLPIQLAPTAGFVTMNVYEDTEYIGGTDVVIYNRNRTTGNESVATSKAGATGTTKGTLFTTVVAGTVAQGGNRGGGSGSNVNAVVLDKSKRYLYEITCSETATVGIQVEFAEI